MMKVQIRRGFLPLVLLVFIAGFSYVNRQAHSSGGQDLAPPVPLKSNNPQELLEKARRELAQNPYHAHWHGQAAIAYGLMGDMPAAERELAEAIRQDHENPIYYYHLASFRYEQGNVPGALVAMNQAVGLDPNNPVVHCDLGLLIESSGNAAGALREYRLCEQNLAYSGNDAYSDKRGNAYGTTELASRVRKTLERLEAGKSLARSTADPHRNQRLGAMQGTSAKVDPHKILKEAQEKLKRDPHSALWHREASWAYYLLGDPVSADEEVKKAIMSDPGGSSSYLLAAYLSERRGATQQEIDLLRQTVSLDPENPVGHFRLANAMERTGELQTALFEYRLCLKTLSHARDRELYVDSNGLPHSLRGLKDETEKRMRTLRGTQGTIK